MLIDITFIFTFIYRGKSSSNHTKYLSHDHNLVAGKVKLFDSLSKNNFGMTIRIHLIMQFRVKIKVKKRADSTHIGCIKRIDSCIITFQGNYHQNRIIAKSRILIILTLP